uniref:Amino acid transporter family protein n=2 Tax=Spironucleus salmonicida TaxID=348837 RepID=V6LBR7_9EUKA|eukprot:EST41882.1 Amino acid transporter family protein [Spironucleus salmonicida]
MMWASLLSLPSLVQKLGLPAVIVLYIFSIIFTLWIYDSFVDAAYYTQARSYRQMILKILGKKASIVLDVSIIVNYYGVTTAYMVIASQNYISFLKQVADFDANPYITKVVIACIIFCLCLLRNLKQLGKIASIALLTIFIFSFTLIAYFFIGLKSKQLCPAASSYGIVISPKVGGLMTFVNFLAYLPATQGAFTAHIMIPTMLSEMEGPNIIKKKVLKISLLIACVSAFCLYMLSGIMGATIFGSAIADNVLVSFQPCKFVWIYIMQFCYGLVIIIVYPLIIYPIKVSFVSYLPQFKEWKVHLTVSVVVVVATMALAMVFESILTTFVCSHLFQYSSLIIFPNQNL